MKVVGCVQLDSWLRHTIHGQEVIYGCKTQNPCSSFEFCNFRALVLINMACVRMHYTMSGLKWVDISHNNRDITVILTPKGPTQTRLRLDMSGW